MKKNKDLYGSPNKWKNPSAKKKAPLFIEHYETPYPTYVPPNHPTSHMRALDQDDEGASSYQPDAAQIQGGRHIPWKIEGFYFLSRDRYKALYFNLLKTIRLAAIGCDDKDGEAGRD